MAERNYTPLDRLLIGFDQTLRTLFGKPKVTERPNPADGLPEGDLDDQRREQTARLMRIDHSGEVCAQALYQGQALTAELPEVRARMERAAREENDHLEWCDQRLRELGSHKSLLNPAWYLGSFTIGAIAGLAGDKWSLGFVAETEHQVVRHLEEHLHRIPPEDRRSRAILEQMKRDEQQHATQALEGGGAPLPEPVKLAM
ncbi:MAG TPA: 2-polyprenyl-3-methyl-6-methoxy-1,4-benzoquinone monooxygenase, partial [Sedimenticola sp.]|nr:2-polyprenyl-3-methyl-6-methoxy-1,4-benzoquinone monooxygenase [Sedimenticola sp.]